MPSPATKDRPRSTGGANFHKNPDCACTVCTARRRKAQALALTTGAGGSELEPKSSHEAALARGEDPIGADIPFRVTKRTARGWVAQWAQIRAAEPNITNVDVAKRLGISRCRLQACLTRATREGWLIFEDPISKIEYEIVPKVVRNLNKFLDEEDKTVTIETAKGTIFKVYQDSKTEQQTPQTMLAIKIEPADGDKVHIVAGHVVGKPKEINNDETSS